MCGARGSTATARLSGVTTVHRRVGRIGALQGVWEAPEGCYDRAQESTAPDGVMTRAYESAGDVVMARMRVANPMSDEAFERLALGDPSAHWELYCGVPRRKPGMTFEHNEVSENLAFTLHAQLDRREYRVRTNKGHVRRPRRSYFIPDVFVIPRAAFEPKRGHPDDLEAYTEPLPLVVEVWSRSTGGYDVTDKLAEYQRRGDAEIWLIHPYERTLTAWRRRPDGSYDETVIIDGIVRPVALPGVEIDLARLFE
jgi:Uma2 family endonuclease